MFLSLLLSALLLGAIHPAQSSTVRINALGDSITGSPVWLFVPKHTILQSKQ